MKINSIARADDITLVELVGRLDTTAVEDFGDLFQQATAGRERPTIVDLSQIDFMASRGIGLLLSCNKALKKLNHRLVLVNPQLLVDASLRSMRIESLMSIVYDLDAAVQIASGARAAVSDRPRAAAAADAATAAPASAAAPDLAQLQLSIDNNVSELARLNAAIGEFLQEHQAPPRAAYAVNLAIDELVTNVIRYAYVDDDVHKIDVKLAIEGEQIVLRLTDDGRPFDPRTGPALDLHAEDRQVGGMGIMLVLDMVDALRYQRVNEQNVVEVRIHLAHESEQLASAAAEGE